MAHKKNYFFFYYHNCRIIMACLCIRFCFIIFGNTKWDGGRIFVRAQPIRIESLTRWGSGPTCRGTVSITWPTSSPPPASPIFLFSHYNKNCSALKIDFFWILFMVCQFQCLVGLDKKNINFKFLISK